MFEKRFCPYCGAPLSDGCALSEWGKKVLQTERQRLEHELEGMFYTNYAIRQYRNHN